MSGRIVRLPLEVSTREVNEVGFGDDPHELAVLDDWQAAKFVCLEERG